MVLKDLGEKRKTKKASFLSIFILFIQKCIHFLFIILCLTSRGKMILKMGGGGGGMGFQQNYIPCIKEKKGV